MNLLETVKFCINTFFSDLWSFLKNWDVGDGVSYGAVIIGFIVLSFFICKFWKFGSGD